MIQTGKRIMLAALLVAYVAGTVVSDTNIVFAAEQTTSQEQQTPTTADQQNSQNEHAGHHG